MRARSCLAQQRQHPGEDYEAEASRLRWGEHWDGNWLERRSAPQSSGNARSMALLDDGFGFAASHRQLGNMEKQTPVLKDCDLTDYVREMLFASSATVWHDAFRCFQEPGRPSPTRQTQPHVSSTLEGHNTTWLKARSLINTRARLRLSGLFHVSTAFPHDKPLPVWSWLAWRLTNRNLCRSLEKEQLQLLSVKLLGFASWPAILTSPRAGPCGHNAPNIGHSIVQNCRYNTTDSAGLRTCIHNFDQFGFFATCDLRFHQQNSGAIAFPGTFAPRLRTSHSRVAKRWPIWSLRTHIALNIRPNVPKLPLILQIRLIWSR